MNPILALARPDILEMEPYQHARWDPSLERLHANEMPWRAPGDNTLAGLNRYPEPQPQALIARLAELYEVAPENVLAGRGSDEAIDLLVRAFCRAGQDGVVVCPPTFGMYRVAARIQGARVIEAPLTADEFALDLPAVISAGQQARLVFLCSPNNPTGRLLDEEMVLEACRQLAANALVVVDEAYVEFATRTSLSRHLSEHPNLVVLRTLSKAWALAGARCGSLLAGADIVDLLRRIIPPYAITAATVDEVLELTELRQRAVVESRTGIIRRERERVRTGLTASPGVVRVHESDANFLLVRCRDPQQVMRAAAETGLLLRNFSRAPGLEGCVRITIGTPEQNDRLLAAVEQT